MGTLTSAELAFELGTTIDRVADLVSIRGLKPRDGLFETADIHRAKAILTFLDAGIRLDHLDQLIDEGSITFDFVDQFFLAPAPASGRTFAEFCTTLDDAADLVPRVYVTLGFPVPEPTRLLRQDEEDLITRLIVAWRGVGGDQAVGRAARLAGESTRQMVDGWLRLYMEVMTSDGSRRTGPPEEAIEERLARGRVLAELMPPLLVWLQQRHLEDSMFALNVDQMEGALRARGMMPPRDLLPPAIAFVDLTGFTFLTATEGDEAAVRSAVRLEEESHEACRRHGGRVVKLLGDGAMLHFDDPRDAVRGVAELLAALPPAGLPPAHAGIHAGKLIARDGDYLGATVNIAARVADYAGAGEVLITAPVVDVWEGADFAFEPLGARSIKGLDEELDLFRVVTRT
jgi:adenylate cyclase